MNVYFNQEEIRRQNREHNLRMERLGRFSRRQEWAAPLQVVEEPAPAIVPVPVIVRALEPIRPACHDHGFDLHVTAWREAVWEKPDGDKAPTPTVHQIVMAAADFYGLSKIEMLSTRRQKSHSKCRQVAMYLATALTTKSLPVIGAAMERDHTTILHGKRKIAGLIERDLALAAEVEAIRLKLIGGDDADPGRS